MCELSGQILPPENETAVFDRMRAERAREAKAYRSEGEEQALTIRAETDLSASQILAEAEEEAQGIRGAGDAEALRIYAAAYEGANKFYEFTRTLEAYEKALNANTHIVLPADGDFFQVIEGQKKQVKSIAQTEKRMPVVRLVTQ